MNAGEDYPDEWSRERVDRTGRELASAIGYLVLGPDGELGRIAYLRYQRHHDHPDQIVLKRKLPRLRRRAIPFAAIEAVNPREHVVLVKTRR
jgi:hypothetical protein